MEEEDELSKAEREEVRRRGEREDKREVMRVEVT